MRRGSGRFMPRGVSFNSHAQIGPDPAATNLSDANISLISSSRRERDGGAEITNKIWLLVLPKGEQPVPPMQVQPQYGQPPLVVVDVVP